MRSLYGCLLGVVFFSNSLLLPKQSFAASLQTSSSVGVKGDALAAKIGALEITQAEVLESMKRVFGDKILETRTKAPEQFAQAFSLFRDQLVSMKLIASAAKREADALKKDAATAKALAQMEEQILVAAWTKKLMDNIITEAALKEAFAKHPKNAVSLKVVVVKDESTGRSVIKALQAGKSFETLAKTKSMDKQSASNGGALPPLLESQLPPVYLSALKDVKIGSFTEKPIPVMDKWHVLYLAGKEKAGFEQAKPALQEVLSREALQKVIGNLKNKGDVTLYNLAGQPTQETSPIFSGTANTAG